MNVMDTNKKNSKKKLVTIYLDEKVIDYFKNLSGETGVSYQTLINMYLMQCVREKKLPSFS